LIDKYGFIFVICQPTKITHKMAKGKNQHVVTHSDGWAVRGEGNGKVTMVTATQREAIQIARQIAQKQQSELLIHGKNGQIRERDSFGNDPFPPKG
jgi:hypothetical protein